MLRPIDLQVVIVKSVDSAQNVEYSQQMMSSAQQITTFEQEKQNTLNRSRVISKDRTQNPNVGTSTDSNKNGKTFYSFKRRKKESENSDPYRGKVIDIRL